MSKLAVFLAVACIFLGTADAGFDDYGNFPRTSYSTSTSSGDFTILALAISLFLVSVLLLSTCCWLWCLCCACCPCYRRPRGDSNQTVVNNLQSSPNVIPQGQAAMGYPMGHTNPLYGQQQYVPQQYVPQSHPPQPMMNPTTEEPQQSQQAPQYTRMDLIV